MSVQNFAAQAASAVPGSGWHDSGGGGESPRPAGVGLTRVLLAEPGRR
jgi:hypothetical protein